LLVLLLTVAAALAFALRPCRAANPKLRFVCRAADSAVRSMEWPTRLACFSMRRPLRLACLRTRAWVFSMRFSKLRPIFLRLKPPAWA